jgi:hypothetical protein
VGLLIVATSDWERIHAKDAEALLAGQVRSWHVRDMPG